MRWRQLGLVVTAACGRIDFDPLAETSGDAAPPADACMFGTFGPPRQLAEVNSSSDDWGGWISPDRLELLFASDRGGSSFQIYRARRAATSGMFGTPLPIALGVPGSNDDAFVSDDGLTLYFDATLTAGPGLDLYVATRPSTATEFANATQLVELNSGDDDSGATVTSDELTIVFESGRPGGAGSLDLYTASRTSRGLPFGPPQLLSTINTADSECCSSLAGDGNTLVFVSDHASPGTGRLVQSQRVAGQFQAPVPLDSNLAAATGDELDATLSRDGTTLVFSSNRTGGPGGYDLYIAERACL